MSEKDLSVEQMPAEQSVNEERRWRFAPVATLAASLVATFGANYLIGHGEMPVVHHDAYTTTSDPVVTSSSTPHTIVYEPAPRGVGDTTPLPPELVTEVEAAASVGWAELFAEDAAAHETNIASVNETADRVSVLLAEGKKDIVITLTGHTSAEDDLDNTVGQQTAGTQTDSVKNQELGTMRALVYGQKLLTALAERGHQPADGFNLELGQTKEQTLTDDQLATGQELAGRYRFADFRAMVQTWQRTPGKVPAEVSDFFVNDVRFPDNRFVSPSLRYTTVVPTEPGEKLQAVCEYTITEVSSTHTQHVPPFDDPYLIPVPVPVWLKRRQKKAKEEPVAEEIIEPTPPKPPVEPKPEPTEEELEALRLARIERFNRIDRCMLRGFRATVAALLLLAGYAEYKSTIDWDTCFVDVTKEAGSFLPDVDFHWDCHWPDSGSDDPEPTIPPTVPVTVPVDPCDVADRVRVTRVHEEHYDGEVTGRTTSVESTKR